MEGCCGASQQCLPREMQNEKLGKEWSHNKRGPGLIPWSCIKRKSKVCFQFPECVRHCTHPPILSSQPCQPFPPQASQAGSAEVMTELGRGPCLGLENLLSDTSCFEISSGGMQVLSCSSPRLLLKISLREKEQERGLSFSMCRWDLSVGFSNGKVGHLSGLPRVQRQPKRWLSGQTAGLALCSPRPHPQHWPVLLALLLAIALLSSGYQWGQQARHVQCGATEFPEASL